MVRQRLIFGLKNTLINRKVLDTRGFELNCWKTELKGQKIWVLCFFEL